MFARQAAVFSQVPGFTTRDRPFLLLKHYDSCKCNVKGICEAWLYNMESTGREETSPKKGTAVVYLQ